MSRMVVLWVTGVMLLLAASATPAPVGKAMNFNSAVNANESKNYPIAFKGKDRASIVVIGDGKTYLALYVYDPDGNCVAWDDDATFGTHDDLAAEWYPAQTASYTVEVRNLGMRRNAFQL